jgi:hypothetical protein
MLASRGIVAAEGILTMTMTPEIAARVAALLDAGCPGQVRDLYEDLAAEWGEDEARHALYWSLIGYRFACFVRRGGLTAPNVRHTEALFEELGCSWRD